MSALLLALGVVLVAARVVGWAAVRVGQPRVVGEIVAGVLIGPSVLGAFGGVVDTDRLFPSPTRSALGAIGQLGLLLFMLMVGLGFDPRMLAGRVRAVLIVAGSVVVIPVSAGFALLPVLYNDRFVAEGTHTAFALFVGAMLSVTAFPVMVRILEERSLHTSPFGVVAIAAAAVVTVLMFVVTAVAREVTDATTADLVMVPARIVAYLVFMLGVVAPMLRRVGHLVDDLTAPATLALAMIVTLVSGRLAVDAGLGVIVGGFVAGLALPRRSTLAPIVSARLGDVVGTVLLPVFLATSGLVTDLTTLGLGTLPGLALFLVVAVASKWAVGTGVARLVGLPSHEANALGILMNCRGLLVLVVGLAAFEAGVITPQMQVGSVLVALVTTGMTGPLFSRAITR
jgi:Kef-type K+ transport system membrane component KefB